MKVAVVYQYYQGREAPGLSQIYELTHYLAAQGHEVSVISGETGYMTRELPTLPWYKRLVRHEQDSLVKVVRTYTYPVLHQSYVRRLFAFLSFSLSCPLGLLSIKKPDVVLASSPPIFPMVSAWLICKIRRIPFVFEVRDLWPASAVQMGILKSKPLIAIMAAMEKLLYNQAKKIVVLTEGIRKDICDRGWPAEKVELVTCGVDFSQLYPDPPAGVRIREHFGWQDKKVVMYFGSLGEAHNLPVILRAAERCRDRQDIVFVMVGDGMKRTLTEQTVAERHLDNVQILPAVPKEAAREYINAADLCLSTLLDIELFQGAIPTKLLDYFACGKPVLCGIRGESERIVEQSGAGFCFSPDDDAELSRLVIECLRSPEQAASRGASGLDYVRRHFSADKIRGQMEAILLEVVQKYSGSAVGVSS